MLIKKIIPIVLTLFFIHSVCSGQSTDIYNFNGPVTEVNSEVISLDEDLFQPMTLKKVDDFLVITDASNTPSIRVFQIKNRSSLSHLHHMGKEGRGPGEFLNPWSILSGQGDTLFYVYDAGLRRITPYDHNFQPLTDNMFTLKASGVPFDLHLYDNQILATGITPDCRFEVFAADGENTECVGNEPDLGVSSDVTKMSIAQRWHSYSTFDDESNNLAIFYRHAAFGVLLSEDGNLINERKDDDLGVPDARVSRGNAVAGNNEIRAYLSVTSDSDFIYALYSGKYFTGPESSYGNELHRFDKGLNLISIYKLDHDSISIEADGEGGIYSLQHTPDVAVRFVDLK